MGKNTRTRKAITHQRNGVQLCLIHQNEQMVKGYNFYMGSYYVTGSGEALLII